MKSRSLGIILLILLLISCQNDISVSLMPKNTYYGTDFNSMDMSKMQDFLFQDTYYELFWRDGFPINYFNYSYRNTVLLLQQYGNISESTKISSVEIIIEELNISQLFEIDSNMAVSKNNDMYLITLRDCLSDFLTAQNDLLKFKDITEVSVNVLLCDGINKKTLKFNFVPVIKKSNRLLNNFMSV